MNHISKLYKLSQLFLPAGKTEQPSSAECPQFNNFMYTSAPEWQKLSNLLYSNG